MSNIEHWIADVHAKATSAFEQLGQEEVDAIRADLDVPIEYLRNAPPIRSAPGEPPRRGVKEHPLQDSVKHAVEDETDVVTLTVGAGPVFDPVTGGDYAVGLEVGEGLHHPRPFIGPSLSR